MESNEEIKEQITQAQKIIRKLNEGGKKNAASIGMSAAVVISWGVTTFSGVSIPAEVVAAGSGLLSSIATNIQNGGK